MNPVTIAGRPIGAGSPVFIVAETGTTCNGSVETALEMVDAAAEAGVDAVKFQMIGADFFMSDTSITYEYDWAGGRASENMYEMFKSLELEPDEWRAVRDRCRERGLIFYATVDYLPGVTMADELEVPAFKLSSWDLGNVPLIRAMAATGKPIVVDLGPARLTEIEALIDLARAEGNDQVVLIHCSHATDDAGINVRSIPYLERTFRVPVGYSADSRDQVPDIAAIALGARMLEKRLTLDHTHAGHHHVKALEPAEFRAWVATVRRVESMLGEEAVTPSAEDLRQKEMYFVSVVADLDIPAGATIEQAMLACKRPGTGIEPRFLDLLVGRTARREIKRNELLSWDAV